MPRNTPPIKDDLMNVLDERYDVRSGVFAAMDSDVTMTLNEHGEYQSVIPGSVISNPDARKELSSVSAMSNNSPSEDDVAHDLFESIKDIKKTDVIGYHLGLFAGHVVEDDYRKKASSGGLTTWLLVELLKKKHIDGVIHMHVSADKNKLFEYGISKTVKDIRNNTKTRYYPGELSKPLREITKLPGKYAVVGLPSIIMEVRLLARQNPEIGKKIAFAFGLICGHQKSTKYAESLAWQVGIKPGDLQSIDFRKKIPGAHANDYATEMTGLINGKLKTIVKKQPELFGSHWGYGFFKTKFSDFTDDALNETADVALGDAWLPAYKKDSLGNNILIVRNKLILSILEAGLSAGKLKLDELSKADILKSQSGLIHHTRDDLPYRLHKRKLAGKWYPKKRVKESGKIPLFRRLVQNLRENLRDKSHQYHKEAVELDDWTHFERKMKPLVLKYKLVYVLIQIKRRGFGWFIRALVKRVR